MADLESFRQQGEFVGIAGLRHGTPESGKWRTGTSCSGRRYGRPDHYAQEVKATYEQLDMDIPSRPQKRIPSCDICRARKVKCIKSPSAEKCDGCVKLDVDCEYTIARRNPGPING